MTLTNITDQYVLHCMLIIVRNTQNDPLASPGVEHWGTCPLDFQQYFSQLILEPHKVYNSRLYLVLHSSTLKLHPISSQTSHIGHGTVIGGQ